MQLINDDLKPVPPEKRTWNRWHFAALWVGMCVCIPTYMLASSMIEAGMSWWQALLTVFLGNAIVLVPMILNAHAGTAYGIPFPVFARASFGVIGANVPAMLRAIVACGWFGIQTWIGGTSVQAVIAVVWPGFNHLPNVLPAFMGVSTASFICFMLFWFANIYIIWKGSEAIKWVENLCAPFLIVSGLALLAWGVVQASGFDAVLTPGKLSGAEFVKVFIPMLTAMVGFWATLSLNIADFSRYAIDQKEQRWGQAIGLPPTMVLFSFIGIAVTGATVVIYGEAIWDPVAIVSKFDNPLIVFVSMFALMIATLSTNIAANIVGPANDFSHLWPEKISFKRGALITGVIGVLILPWKLVADPSGYVFTWLIGYSALLGPIAGIMLVDYFILRKTILVAADLYKMDGVYAYTGGVNFKAVAALVIGVVPSLPGFLAQVGLVDAHALPDFFMGIYQYAWFAGLAVAGTVYCVLMQFAGAVQIAPARAE